MSVYVIPSGKRWQVEAFDSNGKYHGLVGFFFWRTNAVKAAERTAKELDTDVQDHQEVLVARFSAPKLSDPEPPGPYDFEPQGEK